MRRGAQKSRNIAGVIAGILLGDIGYRAGRRW